MLALVLLGSACGANGGGSTSNTTEEPATSTTQPNDDTPDVVDELSQTMQAATFGELQLGTADTDCLTTAIAALQPHQRQTIDDIVADRVVYEELDVAVRVGVAQMYFGCVDEEPLRRFAALSATNIADMDAIDCIADEWQGQLTNDVAANAVASLASFEDLPDPIVTQLTAGVVKCYGDLVSWAEEVALEIDDELAPDDAACVGTAVVRQLGVEYVARRHVLTLYVGESTPLADEQRLELGSGCAASMAFDHGPSDLAVGACWSGFGNGAVNVEVVSCTGSHNAEVIGIHDLSSKYTQWPGKDAIQGETQPACEGDCNAVAPTSVGEPVVNGAGYQIPTRAAWERGERTLTCVAFHNENDEYVEWEGSSGLT